MSIDRLKSLLNRINNKKSNPNLLNRILDQKQKELCAIKKFQDLIKHQMGNNVTFCTSLELRDLMSHSNNVGFVFEFAFHSFN